MDILDIDALCSINCVVLRSTLDQSRGIVHVISTSADQQRSLGQVELASWIESTPAHQQPMD
jgi:hypothetical protein